MRYETLMTVLKFADKTPTIKQVGDWVITDIGKRGPLVKSVEDGIAEGYLAIDPLNRLHLTDMGKRKLYKVGGNVRLTVAIPKEREAEFRKLLVEFLR